MAKCGICNKRKGKRYCKSLGQWICAECCGEKRFKEINCPNKCVYLKQAQEYSLEKIEEVPPLWLENKLWNLHLNMEFQVYNFLEENPNFTDEEYKEVISLLEKEYEVRSKNLFLPSLLPKSSRSLKLKNILQEFLNNVEKIEDEFGLPVYSIEDIRKILSWERERIEEYQEKNKNAGFNLFLQLLKRYVEYFRRLPKERKSSFLV